VNSGLKELASKYKITFVDLYPHFTDGDHRLKEEYTYDGIHLSMEGYRKWAEVLRQGEYLKRKGH